MNFYIRIFKDITYLWFNQILNVLILGTDS